MQPSLHMSSSCLSLVYKSGADLKNKSAGCRFSLDENIYVMFSNHNLQETVCRDVFWMCKLGIINKYICKQDFCKFGVVGYFKLIQSLLILCWYCVCMSECFFSSVWEKKIKGTKSHIHISSWCISLPFKKEHIWLKRFVGLFLFLYEIFFFF